MKYFDKDGVIYGYDDEQIEMGLAKGLSEVELPEITVVNDPPPLTKRQFNLYMYDKGFAAAINELFNADERAKIEFDSVSEIYRDNETVKVMSEAMNWTDSEVDEMWQEALKL